MNQGPLKSFAASARTYLLDAVRARAATFGVTAKGVAPLDGEGVDFIRFNGVVYPQPIKNQRARLVVEAKARGLDAVTDEVAYTWFNRLAALRYMEVNDFLPSGVRILSSATPGKSEPDLLTQALSVGPSLGVKDDDIHRMLDRHEEPELYRRLLTAQCNALSGPLPFLFERLADYSELLLPDGLLHPGGFIDKLVHDIGEEDWREIEIVGWLYQFYIKDRKDQVIGSVVKKEDIPAATQLFTPRWIVEYMVQNSLGRLWLEMYPTSPLRTAMKYYVENPDDKDLRRDAIKLEDIRCLDDACGSGHILVVMFDLLFEMYRERGYEEREIPSLILRHNLVGIDIDRRAAQLAAFAVAMKARSRDRRFFERGVAPHIIEIVESNDLDPEDALQVQKKSLAAMRTSRVEQDDLFTGAAARQPELFEAPVSKAAWMKPLADLFHLFEDAKNYGSLLTVPEALARELPALRRMAVEWNGSGDSFVADFGAKVLPLVDQAEALAAKYHVVVANPPYMGGKGMNAQVKEFAKKNYKDAKADLFAMFIERNIAFCQPRGMSALITMQSWMFLSSYEDMRVNLLGRDTILTMAHLGARAFDSIGGEVVQTTAFVVERAKKPEFKGTYFRLVDGDSEAEKERMLRDALTTSHQPLATSHCFSASAADFAKIPGSPVAYWISERMKAAFQAHRSLGETCDTKQGIATGDNARFLRTWPEVTRSRTSFSETSLLSADGSGGKWFPYSKGGEARKWYGNHDLVVDWSSGGLGIRRNVDDGGKLLSRPQNLSYQFREAATWSLTSSLDVTAGRWRPSGFMFDVNGMSAFGSTFASNKVLAGLISSRVAAAFLRFINPTLAFQSGDIARLPLVSPIPGELADVTCQAVSLARADWDNFETSWDFADLPLLRSGIKQATLEATWNAWADHLRANIARMQELETENNRLWIDAYGLQDELKPEVPEAEITLARPDGAKDMAAFVSYAVGCMMGRYALDKTGLILADAGDGLAQWEAKVGKPVAEATFAPDKDGVIPVLDENTFSDDLSERVVAFLKTTFGDAALEGNLDFLADALVKRKKNETSREALRRYLATQFFKDHCQTYKNRPIYWLFTSGPERAFQALVYLHRYRPDTLARLRTEYLHPLQTRLDAEVTHLEAEPAGSGKSATAAGKKLATVKAKLRELASFDEKLKHYADMRIALDLDDGVKVNYKKFYQKGLEIVAPVQGVTSGKEDEE